MTSRGVVLTANEISQVLSGQKTLLITPILLKSFHRTITPGYDYAFRDKQGRWNEYVSEDLFKKKCPYGPSTSTLFVRERWSVVTDAPGDLSAYVRYADGKGRACRMDAERPLAAGLTADRWRPALQMPEWASRITLYAHTTRVLRLQSIDTHDMHRYGIRPKVRPCPICVPTQICTCQCADYTNGFQRAWDIPGRKYAQTYAANPWVWVAEFRLQEVKT